MQCDTAREVDEWVCQHRLDKKAHDGLIAQNQNNNFNFRCIELLAKSGEAGKRSVTHGSGQDVGLLKREPFQHVAECVSAKPEVSRQSVSITWRTIIKKY